MRKLLLTLVVLALLIPTGCKSMVEGTVDDYLETLEDRAIRDAKQAAQDVGAPIDLYATLFDKSAEPAARLRLAGKLFGDLFRNAVPPESIIHVMISISVMLGHQYRGDPG